MTLPFTSERRLDIMSATSFWMNLALIFVLVAILVITAATF